MQPDHPIIGDLVLVGGGHAQVALLKSLAMNPVPGLRNTLICREVDTPYSGMLPGFVEGVWSQQDIHIDLARLAGMAGARLITAPVTAIHADGKRLDIAGRPSLPYDVLSINIGGEPDLAAIDGAAAHCIPVKPIGLFRQQLATLTEAGHPKRLAVIGGGAAGCELALALSARWQRDAGTRPDIRVFGRAARLVPEHPPRAARHLFEAMTAVGCRVQSGVEVTRIEEGRLHLDNGETHEFDACFLVSAVAPPKWLAGTGLDLDPSGFISVSASLQSTSPRSPAIRARRPVSMRYGRDRFWHRISADLLPESSHAPGVHKSGHLPSLALPMAVPSASVAHMPARPACGGG
jgi:selenide,water dikinase